MKDTAKKSILDTNKFVAERFTSKCVSCKMPTPPEVIDENGLCPACGGTKRLNSTFYN